MASIALNTLEDVMKMLDTFCYRVWPKYHEMLSFIGPTVLPIDNHDFQQQEFPQGHLKLIAGEKLVVIREVDNEIYECLKWDTNSTIQIQLPNKLVSLHATRGFVYKRLLAPVEPFKMVMHDCSLQLDVSFRFWAVNKEGHVCSSVYRCSL